MIYVIKADNEIAYVGRIEDATDEAWQQEYEKHKEKILAYDHDELEEFEKDFYFQLYYWKESEHREIKMERILHKVAAEDEERAMYMLIEAIEPIGNIEGWRIPGRETWW